MGIEQSPSASPASKPAYIISLALLLVFVVWNTSWRLTPGWSADDGVHLRFSSVYSVRDYLFNPELLRIASYANLTPLLNLFYSFNLSQLGLDASAWRASSGALSVAAVAAFYAASSQYMRPALALFVVGAWVLGAPFFYTAATFMTSHYMLGMLGASLCVWSFFRWVRQGAGVYLVGAVLFYGLAIFAKEVFVPLPALLILHKPWRRAAWGVTPMALLLGIYLALRHAVFGSVVGGYRSGHFIKASDGWPLIERLAQLPATLFGGGWQAATYGLVFFFFLWRATGGLRFVAAAAVGVVLLPLLPLVAASNLTEPDRYFFVASAVALFLIGLMIESSLHHRSCRPGLAFAVCALILFLPLLQQLQHVPALVRGLNTQAAIYNHVLGTTGPMLILNPELPADAGYWSHVLNGARETQARLSGRDRYDKVLMVGDPQSPILFGLHPQGIPIYRYDAAGCRCMRPHSPSGVPNHTAVSLVPRQTILLHLENPLRLPENNQSAWGNSVETLRRISPDNPATLEIAGYIHLSTELDWLYLVLPFSHNPVIEPAEPATVTTAGPGGPLRLVHLRLHFPTPQLAALAQEKLCMAVPSVLGSPYALLQGQPAYCNAFVNATLRQPG